MIKKEWLLVGAAMICIPVAAGLLNTGAPAARAMTAGELASNNGEPGRVKVNGEVVDLRYLGGWTRLVVRDNSGEEIQVNISPEAGNNPIAIGNRYSFTGEVLSGETISVTLPNSIKLLRGRTVTTYFYGTVKDGVACKSSGYGNEYFPAPTIADGDYSRLRLVQVEGGGAEVSLP